MTKRIDKPDTQTDIELKSLLDSSNSFIMIAGAGSGKTTSLVKALNHIRIKNGVSMKSKSQKVACITYTVVAEQEIWADLGNDPLCHVSTIHSFLWEQIKPFQKDIKLWLSSRLDEKIEKLLEKRANFGPRVQQKTKDKNIDDEAKYRRIKNYIDNVSKFTYETAANYERGVLGHDDILKVFTYLVEARPLLRKIISQKYPYLFVDESQDSIADIVNLSNFLIGCRPISVIGDQ